MGSCALPQCDGGLIQEPRDFSPLQLKERVPSVEGSREQGVMGH